jgi:hypothetical protein
VLKLFECGLILFRDFPQFREAANVSPTLSSFSSGSNAPLASAGRDESSLAPRTRKIVIRVDHSIATCFDPADKELYDLWSPKA